MRGKFITFEGGEGSGKSTHAATLANRLKSYGIGVELTREPGGSPGAEIIRHVLLSGAAQAFGPDAEAILFAAARADHVNTRIEPALAAGRWVICDRFTDSTRVYQGALGKVDGRLINGLQRLTIGTLMPDLTFVLDVPANTGLERAAARRGAAVADRFESENASFHENLRGAFRALAQSDPERCVLIDGSGTREEVSARVWSIVNSRLNPVTAPISLEDAAS